MTNFARAALVALALFGAASAASAATRYDNDNSQAWNSDARTFFDKLQRNGN